MTSEHSSAPAFSVHVAWTLAARLLMTVNSVLASIITARWLGVEGVGQLGVLTVSIALAVQLGSAGLPSAGIYFIAKDKRNFFSAAVNAFVFAVVAGSGLALALIVLGRTRPEWFSFISPDLITVAALSIPFQLITVIGLNLFLGLGDVQRFNWLDVAGQSFVLFNAIVALVLLRTGLEEYVALNTAAGALMAIVIVLLLVRYGKRLKQSDNAWRADRRLFARMVRYGFKFHASIIMAALIFRADLLVVNMFRGAAEAGVYSVVSQIGMMLMLLPGVIATILFPRVTEAQDTTGQQAMLATRHTAFIMFCVCLAAAPLSFLLPRIYGPGFSDVPVQVIILLFGIYLIGLQSVLVQHFNAMGVPVAIPGFWLATLLLNIILVFLLVPRFGARGAALASSLSYAMMFVVVLFYFRRTTRNRLSTVLLIQPQELRRLLYWTWARHRA